MKSIEFTTAQHVKIEYEIASTGQRVAASIIDLFAFFIYFLILSFSLGRSLFQFDYGTGQFLILLLLRLPWVFYSPVIEYLTRGQSLGKFTLGIRVVKISGENAGLREYFTRWIFRVVDIWFGFGFLAILFSSTSERGQRLGDTMANTIVIRKKSSRQYNLKNVLGIKNTETHQTTYQEVIRFTDEDMMLIKKTLQRLERHPSRETKQFAIDLANKTAEHMGLEATPDKKVAFLRTVLLDYVVLTR
ncbi:MAG: RDD family protein [Bacteroidetes bacterium]|nr:MAG: RDD family protein [Bacteroidota bacterium]